MMKFGEKNKMRKSSKFHLRKTFASIMKSDVYQK